MDVILAAGSQETLLSKAVIAVGSFLKFSGLARSFFVLFPRRQAALYPSCTPLPNIKALRVENRKTSIQMRKTIASTSGFLCLTTRIYYIFICQPGHF